MANKRAKRKKTRYPEVYFEERTHRATKKPANFFYIRYLHNGKRTFELVGNSAEGMTGAKANIIRGQRIAGKMPSNKERRETEKARQEAENNKWTIARLWEAYKAANPTLKRMRTDSGLFKNHLEEKFGDKEPQEIAPLDVDRLRINLSKRLKPATVWAALELLKRLVNFGVKRNLCQALGFYVKMPKVQNEKTEDLTPEQLQNLMAAIEADISVQAKNFMKLVLFTGMRRGELFNLKWSDIDFDKKFILIRDPKGGKPQKIPLSKDAEEILINHEEPYPESPYVFPGRNGGKRTDIKFQVTRIKKRAGLPKDFRPLHGLRHVYASMLASSGKVDLYTLQKLLTHKSPQMTQRYAHLRDETLKKASDLAGNIVGELLNPKEKKVVNLEDYKK